MTLPDHGAIADGDVPEISCRLGPQLDRVVKRREMTPRHAHVLGRAVSAEREARLQAERVVARFDVTPRDAYVLTAVRIDAIRVSVQDRQVLDVDALAAEKRHGVVAGVGDGEIADVDLLAALQGNRLRAFALPPIAVDPPGPDEPDLLHVTALDEGEAVIRRLAVCERVVAELLRRVEVPVFWARDQDRARIELKGRQISKVQRAREIVSRREIDRPAGSGGVVDRGLDGARVLGLPIAPRTMVAYADRRGALGDSRRPWKEQAQRPGPQESPPRCVHAARS
jgi:hypothetical protein